MGSSGATNAVSTRRLSSPSPDPRIFRVALERLRVPAAAALYVGDHPQHDVAAARLAGLRAIDVAGLANLGELIRHLDTPQPREAPR